VTQLEAESPGCKVPFYLPFPDLEGESVPAHHAIALWGGRMVASYFHSCAQEPTASASKQRKTDANSGKRSADAERKDVPPALDLPGAAHLAAIMRLQAPARLTLPGMYDLVQACHVMLVDTILARLPEYMAPALARAPLLEVRLQLQACVPSV
jgi:hypothetical protein